MRNATANNGGLARPRFMVWENVVGAFTSNGGKDFQAVLSEIVKIAEPNAPDVPMPAKNKWPHAGELHDEMGRWSIAWRLIDAQFWGVPQRRKRIALVADFASGGAADILFEQYLGNESEPEIQPQPEGMPGNTEQSTEAREDTSTATGSSPSETIGGGTISFQERAGKPGGGKGILIQNERVGTLSTLNNQSVFTLNGKDVTPPLDAHYGLGAGARSGVEREAVMIYGISSLDSNAMKSPNPKSGIYEDQSIMTFEVDAGKCDMRNRIHMGNVSPTLVSNSGNALFCLEGNGQRESHKGDGYKESETMYTLNTVEQHGVCYSQDRFDKYTENDKSPSLLSSGGMYGGERDTCYIKKQ